MKRHRTKKSPNLGGSRKGAGRRRGTGKYGEPTKVVRIPLSMMPDIELMLADRLVSCRDVKHE